MGLSPQLWGRQAWHFIHLVALTYPNNPTEKDKKQYLKFFKSLEYVLPCPICSDHFKDNMEKIPIRLDDSESLFRWTVDMHNEVNKVHQKKILSYDEALEEIEKNANKIENNINIDHIPKKINNLKPILLSISVSSAIVVFAYLLAKKK